MKTYLLASLLALGLAGQASAETEAPPPALSPQALAVLFYADWCASCKELDPKIKQARKALPDAPVLFTRLDLTDETTRRQAGMLADALGLREIYAEFGGKTGFLLLVDPQTGAIIDRVNRDATVEAIEEKLRAAGQAGAATAS